MKLAKVILGIVVFIVLGAAAFILRSDKKPIVNNQRDDGFVEYRQGKRGDDPLYSEEIRKNTALTQSTLDKQAALEKTLFDTIGKIKADSERQSQASQEKINELTAKINQLQKQSKNSAAENVDAVKAAMNKQINQLTETVTGLQKTLAENVTASQKKIQSLESYIEQELKSDKDNVSTTVSALPDLPIGNTDNTKENSDDNGSGDTGLGVNATALAQPAPPTNITYPYGYHPSTMNNKDAEGDSLFSRLNHSIADIGGFEKTGGAQNTTPNGYFYDKNADKANGPLPEVRAKAEKVTKWPTVFPVYTLPPNTILADSLLVTPIIGRVPDVSKNVSDPYFFKVEIGSNNLAANGHNIPGIAKMIASGYSTGVREQSCVRGYIDSLTFIFVDGRIVTHGKASNKGKSNGEALGYLTDKWGKPCIRGEYINNAKDYLMSRGVAAFLEAAAQGLSQSQVDVSEDGNGNKQAVLNGKMWQFVFGQGVSGSAGEIASYIRDRALNAVDVVYVEQGKNVQIMLDATIPIDYDSKGRKISYYSPVDNTRSYD